MRLLALRANKSSFNTIVFRRGGLSIILGRKESDAFANRKKTYNSVGKSLAIRIIHFCLGSNPINEFESKLPGWIFELDFEIDGSKFTASRQTSNQRRILLNGADKSLADFRDFLEREVFLISEPVKFLKFRSLISRFLRPKKSSYVSYDNFVVEEEDYARLLNNAYLLGLDVGRVVNKFQLKERHDNIEELKKHIERDDILRAFFEQGRDVEIDIVDLEERINSTEDRLKRFRVAQDYYEIKKEADEISAKLRTFKNEATTYRNSIRNIDKSLTIQPDIPKARILRLYDEASVSFPESVLKKIEEVESFNKKVLKDRSRRLLTERKRLEERLSQLENIISDIGKQEDEKLEYLNTHGALEEFTAMNNQLSASKVRLNKLQTYKELVGEYKNRLEEIKIEFGKENIATNNYLVESKTLIDKNISIFRGLAQEFYENKKAGIEVQNNEGMNRLRFNLTSKIQDDAGDGVNEVKIFCFDWTLLKARHNHKVNFLFHDSRLLSDMDPRQRATLFRLAHTESAREGTQYIVSMNEDMLDSIRPYFSQEEFKNQLSDNIVLELTDKSDESKLLGIQVDMDYEHD
jgi:uncharacterized protein YydD (DUF2326 family)